MIGNFSTRPHHRRTAQNGVTGGGSPAKGSTDDGTDVGEYQLPYPESGAGEGLRRTIQIELTYAVLRLSPVVLPVSSFVNETYRQAPDVPAVPRKHHRDGRRKAGVPHAAHRDGPGRPEPRRRTAAADVVVRFPCRTSESTWMRCKSRSLIATQPIVHLRFTQGSGHFYVVQDGHSNFAYRNSVAESILC